jgi:MoaA/NifB/PqqE/SkfB family radical SAM enzyme
MLNAAPESPAPMAQPDPLRFMWMELTGSCPLECVHCYADSGPKQGHGTMTLKGWCTSLDDAVGLGVRRVSLIGGEPTAHPDFAAILTHALALGLGVEVFSNLFAISARTWDLLRLPGVNLATSYYSDQAGEHDAITTRPGSYRKTRANIVKALGYRIPLRVGLIGLSDDQRTDAARAELIALGVRAEAIGFDRLRAFGRGAADSMDESQTCGGCGHGKAAVLPDGSVAPCVFTRTATTGNVRSTALGEVLTGEAFAAQVARLDALRAPGPSASGGFTCQPDPCVPTECQPADCGPMSACFPRNCVPTQPHGGSVAGFCLPTCVPASNDCLPQKPCEPDQKCVPLWQCHPGGSSTSGESDSMTAGICEPTHPSCPPYVDRCRPDDMCIPHGLCAPSSFTDRAEAADAGAALVATGGAEVVACGPAPTPCLPQNPPPCGPNMGPGCNPVT